MELGETVTVTISELVYVTVGRRPPQPAFLEDEPTAPASAEEEVAGRGITMIVVTATGDACPTKALDARMTDKRICLIENILKVGGMSTVR